MSAAACLLVAALAFAVGAVLTWGFIPGLVEDARHRGYRQAMDDLAADLEREVEDARHRGYRQAMDDLAADLERELARRPAPRR